MDSSIDAEEAFCLPLNLTRYLYLGDRALDEWEVLLAMEPVGFTCAWPRDADELPLTGLSGTSLELLDRFAATVGARVVPVECWESVARDRALLAIVDDRALAYAAPPARRRNQRFVVVHPDGTGGVAAFDAQPRTLDCLRRAVVGAVEIEGAWNAGSLRPALVRAAPARAARWTSCLPALARFEDDVRTRRTELQGDAAYALFFALRRPSGPAAVRFRAAEASERIGARAEHVTAMRELAAEWRVVGNLFFKQSRAPDRRLRDRLAGRLGEILAREESTAASGASISTTADAALVERVLAVARQAARQRGLYEGFGEDARLGADGVGFDSAGMLGLLVDIEDALRVELPEAVWGRAPGTVAALAATVAESNPPRIGMP